MEADAMDLALEVNELAAAGRRGDPLLPRELEPWAWDADPAEEPGVLASAVRLRLSGLPGWGHVPAATKEFVAGLPPMDSRTPLRVLFGSAPTAPWSTPGNAWKDLWYWATDRGFEGSLRERWLRRGREPCPSCGAPWGRGPCGACAARAVGRELAGLLQAHREATRGPVGWEHAVLESWLDHPPAGLEALEAWDAVRTDPGFRIDLWSAWPNLWSMFGVASRAVRAAARRLQPVEALARKAVPGQAPLPVRAWTWLSGGRCVGCGGPVEGVPANPLVDRWPARSASCSCASCERDSWSRCPRCGAWPVPTGLGACLSCLRDAARLAWGCHEGSFPPWVGLGLAAALGTWRVPARFHARRAHLLAGPSGRAVKEPKLCKECGRATVETRRGLCQVCNMRERRREEQRRWLKKGL